MQLMVGAQNHYQFLNFVTYRRAGVKNEIHFVHLGSQKESAKVLHIKVVVKIFFDKLGAAYWTITFVELLTFYLRLLLKA